MKCEYCEAMQNTSYEYQEWECVLGMEEQEFKDGSYGCRHKAKTIKKMLDNMYEAQAKQWEGFAEFVELSDKKDDALMQAIKEVLFSENMVICSKYQDGKLHECNIESVLKFNCWEIRSKYEDLLENIKKEQSLEKMKGEEHE